MNISDNQHDVMLGSGKKEHRETGSQSGVLSLKAAVNKPTKLIRTVEMLRFPHIIDSVQVVASCHLRLRLHSFSHLPSPGVAA